MDYENYDLSEHDPYLIDGSECLKNLLGKTNTKDLNEAERIITQRTIISLQTNPIKPTFDFVHLCTIHNRLFSHVYPFAGQARKVEISKGQNFFLPHALIKTETEKCFNWLKSKNTLRGFPVREFGNKAGFLLGWINRIHAFREGNGRTQRLLIDQLADQSGYAVEWCAISGAAMSEASRLAMNTDKSAAKLARLIELNTVKKRG